MAFTSPALVTKSTRVFIRGSEARISIVLAAQHWLSRAQSTSPRNFMMVVYCSDLWSSRKQMLADNCSRVPNESTVWVGMPHCWNHVVYIVVVNHQNAYIPRAHMREMDQCICIGHMFNRMVVESGSMGSGGGKGLSLIRCRYGTQVWPI